MSDRPNKPLKAFYGPVDAGDAADTRLHTPTFSRNSPPTIAALATYFAGRSGPVLEIGAGTGQHAAAFSLAFPALDWWPSDPLPAHRASIASWARHIPAPVLGSLDIDAAGDWPSTPEITAIGPLTGVLSMNVIHIAPFDVAAGIVVGAGKTLDTNGLLIFYGPFLAKDIETASGNLAFDAKLKASNPAWGLRWIEDIDRLAAGAGLERVAFTPMPRNNRLAIFTKPDDSA